MNNLEERSLNFAIQVRKFVKSLPSTISNYEDSRQLIRSSGSIGANYIEANEALGIKDRLMHLRISRKEAKETIFWIHAMLNSNDLNPSVYQSGVFLINEATEIRSILSSIIHKIELKESKNHS